MGALANLRRGIWASKKVAPPAGLVSIIVGDTHWWRSTSLATWIPITRPFTNGTTAAGYLPAHNRFVVASYATNTAAYSDDGGATWTIAPVGVAINCLFYVEATGELFAFGSATVRKSTDGISWSTQALPAGAWNECIVDPVTGDLFALATSGAIITSVDDGANWTSLTAIGGTGSAQGLVIVPGTDILVASRRSTGGIRRSIDRGVTWSQILAGDYNRAARNPGTGSIIVEPQGVATEARKSADDGATFPTTIPALTSSWPMLKWVPPANAFFAGPFSAMPQYSLDDGVTWQNIPATNVNAQVYAMAWVP